MANTNGEEEREEEENKRKADVMEMGEMRDLIGWARS
jgi:hypothetical protein